MDQAMEYASAIGAMCVGEIANAFDSVEQRMMLGRNAVDARVDAMMEDLQDFDARMAEVEERVGALDRTQDAFDAMVERHDPRIRALEREVRELQQQVADLLVFRAVVQHGPGNPVVVEDDKEEEIEDPRVPVVAAGRLIPLEDEMQADQAADEIARGAAGPAPE